MLVSDTKVKRTQEIDRGGTGDSFPSNICHVGHVAAAQTLVAKGTDRTERDGPETVGHPYVI